MPSIAGAITRYLELAATGIYPNAHQPNDRFVTDGGKNSPIRRIQRSPYQYISPIAHQLAAKSRLAPLAICQNLLEYIPPALAPLSSQLEIQCWYTDKGYICFQLTPRSIAPWLDYIYTWTPSDSIESILYPQNVDLSLALALAKPLPCLTAGLRQQQKPSPCEIVVYAQDRCRSILALAYTEALITKDISGNWQIPPFQNDECDSDPGNNRPRTDVIGDFESGVTDRLIHALMDVLDSICGNRPPDYPRLKIDLAQSWLEFHRHCRIFGDIKRQNPHLAIARCGLTAICERYLE